MSSLHLTIDGCRKQIRAAVYATQAASLDGLGTRWQAHRTGNGNVLDGGERVRLFDVVCVSEIKQPMSVGTDTTDRMIDIEIRVGYGVNENYNELAISDAASIYHSLSNINVSAVKGLHAYIPGEAGMVSQDDARFLVIKLQAMVHSFDGANWRAQYEAL